MPISMIAAINSEVATGRRMKMRDGLTVSWFSGSLRVAPAALAVRALLWICRRSWLCGRRRLRFGCRLFSRGRLRLSGPSTLHQPHLGAILQPIGAIGDDPLSRFEPLGDDDPPIIAGTERDRLRRDRLVGLHDIDEGSRRAALNRRIGDQIGSSWVITTMPLASLVWT